MTSLGVKAEAVLCDFKINLLTKFDLLPVRRIVQRNRLRWFCHVVRMDNDNWVKKCMMLKVYERRDPGRTKKKLGAGDCF